MLLSVLFQSKLVRTHKVTESMWPRNVLWGTKENKDIDPWFFTLSTHFSWYVLDTYVFHHSYRETNDTMTFLMGLLGKCCFPSAPICRGRRSWNVSWSTLMKRQPFLNQAQVLHSWLREKWVWVFVGHSSPVILVVLLRIHEQVVCQMCVSLKLRACTWDWNMFKAIW